MSVNDTLVLIGGTGSLGSKIAPGLYETQGFARKKALVRNKAKAAALKEIGWTIVELPDLNDLEQVTRALEGAKTVVSTLSGNDLVTIETTIVYAAKQAGVSLFVPSQFGVDYTRWLLTHPIWTSKPLVLEMAKQADLPILLVFTGCFSETTFDLVADPVQGKARIIGDGSAKISFTDRSDIGRVLSKALADPKYSNGGTLCMQGETLSWKEAVETLQGALGKKLDVEHVDLAVALEKEQTLLASALQNGDMEAFWESFRLQLIGLSARGFTGLDVSQGGGSESYGLKLKTLKDSLEAVYGGGQ